MKKSLIIAGILAAGAAASFFILRRKRKRIKNVSEPVERSHHLTNVFSKAKLHLQ